MGAVFPVRENKNGNVMTQKQTAHTNRLELKTVSEIMLSPS